MKYRVKTVQEIERDGFDFSDKVRDFIDDIKDNPNAIIEIDEIRKVGNEIKHPNFRGSRGKGTWRIGEDSVKKFFTPHVYHLDEDLFEL